MRRDQKQISASKFSNRGLGFKMFEVPALPIVSIVFPFLVNQFQNLYYRILTIKLVNQKKELQWKL